MLCETAVPLKSAWVRTKRHQGPTMNDRSGALVGKSLALRGFGEEVRIT
jgi:hypothetical protein